MNNDQLNSLLDSIYELEGLVHLAIAREDIPDSLPNLIARKGEELAARAGSLRQTLQGLPDMPANTVKTPEKDSKTRGRLVFSINDRFRFKRELFGNSDADFNNTLALVASMEDYEEAEDYFAGELQWDKSRAEVADFLEILKKYFQ